MNKIISGLLGIMMVTAVVGGTAYALFSDTATVQGINITTGNADIKIMGQDSLSSPALSVANAYPGWQEGEYFYLTNDSDSPIALSTEAVINSYSGNWNALKDWVEVAIVEYSDATQAGNAVAANSPSAGTVTSSTGWQTLSTWESGSVSFGTDIAQGADHYYVIWGRISTSADNTISDKSLSTNWVITGTQVTP